MRYTSLLVLLLLAACGQEVSKSKRLELKGSGRKVVLISGSMDPLSLKNEANALGVNASGEVIIRLEGDVSALNELTLDETSEAILDEKIALSDSPVSITDGALYLAKKDFGILEFWQENPSADGRGVIVGVYDDGISPHHPGFRVTTTGARKILKLGSSSSFATFTLVASEAGYTGVINEERESYDGKADLNGDGKTTQFKAQVTDKVCLDLDLDEKFSDNECRGTFAATGEYFNLPNSAMVLTVEFDKESAQLKIQQPEKAGDSHGEGVASVIASHHPGKPQFDGVAPGAQIVDIDISEPTHVASENEYTMGTILASLEWLAKNGAEVANISYSLFFSSVRSQDFMSKAIDALVKKYNIVLSFSGGNNGPGLGSLNRRAMYPDSVLVAGAFVSKELDERVWGVTGLPEEGRVIYYSSRGPGPLGEGGPLMIAPLSSLTHSSPDAGYGAFSGTSSASPALAGAATVLLSAIKLAGLKVDAPTIVHALRLSGKRLKAEPFVAQGYGLPQVGEALKIYRQLIAGENFNYLTIRTNKGAQDSIPGRGLLFYTSQSSAVENARIDITGVLSNLAPLSARTDLVIPLKLIYSQGIKGSSELWTSGATARLHVEVDLSELLQGQREGFGEIELRHAVNNSLLAIVPVTVLDDITTNVRSRHVLRVGSQGSARIHLNSEVGLFKVKARMLEGEPLGVNFAIYDPDKIRQQQIAVTDEVWVPVTRKGHQQVSVFMAGGTGREAVVEFEIEPLELELRTVTTKANKPVINLRHIGVSALYGKVELIPVSSPLLQITSDPDGEVKALEGSIKITTKGSYSVTLAPLELADNRYFYSNCSSTITDPDGKITLGGAVYVATDDKERTINFRCMPFDHGITGKHGEAWSLTIQKSATEAATKEIALPMRSLSKEVDFKEVEAGVYEVWLSPLIGNQRVKLGSVRAI
jgi:subtilisin family serine protease